MSVLAMGVEEHVLSYPAGMRGICVCMCVCAQGVLFNVYISTIYTPRSWGPYIYSIPCLDLVSSKRGVRMVLQVGQRCLRGGSDARV